MLKRQPTKFVLLRVLILGMVSAGCHKAVPPVAPPLSSTAPAAQPASPPTIRLSADRTAVSAGQGVTLTWQSTNAASVSIDNAIGNVGVIGSRQVAPRVSTTYVATARGAGGTVLSSPVRVTVAATPPPSPQPAPVQPNTPTRSLTLAQQFQDVMQNVLFDYDKAVIRDSEVPKLQAGAQWLLKNPEVSLRIEGNADERGSQEYNVALGDERAAAVRRYLTNLGVRDHRTETLSYGEERPACHELNEDCWQKNRRAQFVMKP